VLKRYLELVCRLKSDSVLSFVKRLVKNEDSEVMKLALEVCRSEKAVDAEAYLLERLGKWKDALSLLLNALRDLFSDHRQRCGSSIESVVRSAIDLCERLHHSSKHDGDEESWFSILDLLASVQGGHHQQERQRALSDVFAAMRLMVSPTRFVHQLETRYGKTRLGDFRAQLRAMSEDSRCTRRLLSDANCVASQDNGKKMRRLHFGKLEATYLPPESFRRAWTHIKDEKSSNSDDMTGDMRRVDRVDMETVMGRVMRELLNIND